MSAIDFKQLWRQQPTPETPYAGEIIGRANAFKRKFRNKLIAGNVLLLATSVFIVWVILHFEPEYATTKIGALLVVSAIVLYVIYSGKMLSLVKAVNPDEDLQHGIASLVALKKKQAFIHTTVTNLYFGLLSVGIFLYMIEYASRMSGIMAVTVYGLTTIWFAFNWFYMRVKTMKRQGQHIDDVLQALLSLQKQFDPEKEM